MNRRLNGSRAIKSRTCSSHEDDHTRIQVGGNNDKTAATNHLCMAFDSGGEVFRSVHVLLFVVKERDCSLHVDRSHLEYNRVQNNSRRTE